MTPNHPGNEPDPRDMSTEPDEHLDHPLGRDLPEDDAAALGDFA